MQTNIYAHQLIAALEAMKTDKSFAYAPADELDKLKADNEIIDKMVEMIQEQFDEHDIVIAFE